MKKQVYFLRQKGLLDVLHFIEIEFIIILEYSTLTKWQWWEDVYQDYNYSWTYLILNLFQVYSYH